MILSPGPFWFSCCHAVCTHSLPAVLKPSISERARHICFFFDYGLYTYINGLIALFTNIMFPIAVVNSVISTALACYSRCSWKLNQKLCKCLWIIAFVYPYLFDNIPLFYRVSDFGQYCSPSAHLAVFTGSLFATHLPEHLAPGSFDYIVNSKLWFFNASFRCHSHQLFHVFGIIGTHFQMTAIDLDMAAQKQWLHAHLLPVTLSNTAGAAFFSVVSGLCIVYVFSLGLFSARGVKDKLI
uniref:Progestin and adipoQ receptor family member Va n=1 Tax=Cyprinus carpio TaxID=7962 RepID=A0A8C1LAM2_CYPCA